jgi:hypothetical protein
MPHIKLNGLWLEILDKNSKEECWIEAWFDLPNGKCVTERFRTIPSGEYAYEQIVDALEQFGNQVLDAKINSLQMSPKFAALYLLPSVAR